MENLHNIAELKSWRTKVKKVAFVPTMGSLHAGHMALVQEAKSSGATVLVSIFLNPTQFNNPEDLEKYPVKIDDDLDMLANAGVDAVFLPDREEIYSDGYEIRVNDHSEDSQVLCANSRPGHFEGVLTIVMKLVMMARANAVYMGEKDFQQLMLVRKMLSSLHVETEVIAVPTVREDGGLALSSRNRRLSEDGLALARVFADYLKKSVETSMSLEELRNLITDRDIEIDYLAERWGRRFAAVEIEGIRLIDNRLLGGEGNKIEKETRL